MAGFTLAARLLGMAKTTVSRRIAALEREVGVWLVQRTTPSLTGEGPVGISPPCSRVMDRATERPSPTPPVSGLRERS